MRPRFTGGFWVGDQSAVWMAIGGADFVYRRPGAHVYRHLYFATADETVPLFNFIAAALQTLA